MPIQAGRFRGFAFLKTLLFKGTQHLRALPRVHNIKSRPLGAVSLWYGNKNLINTDHKNSDNDDDDDYMVIMIANF